MRSSAHQRTLRRPTAQLHSTSCKWKLCQASPTVGGARSFPVLLLSWGPSSLPILQEVAASCLESGDRNFIVQFSKSHASYLKFGNSVFLVAGQGYFLQTLVTLVGSPGLLGGPSEYTQRDSLKPRGQGWMGESNPLVTTSKLSTRLKQLEI